MSNTFLIVHFIRINLIRLTFFIRFLFCFINSFCTAKALEMYIFLTSLFHSANLCGSTLARPSTISHDMAQKKTSRKRKRENEIVQKERKKLWPIETCAIIESNRIALVECDCGTKRHLLVSMTSNNKKKKKPSHRIRLNKRAEQNRITWLICTFSFAVHKNWMCKTEARRKWK